VNLFNTSGLTLIGPGSEWFWTAISGLALVITLLALYRQFRLQRQQIRENTKVLRSQAHYNALTLLQQSWRLYLENESLAAIVETGYQNPEKLSDVDWARFTAYSYMQFNGWEYCYYQFRDGSIPRELWIGTDNTLKDWIRTKPGLARFWSECRLSFDDPFRSEVDREFVRRPAEQPAKIALAIANRHAIGRSSVAGDEADPSPCVRHDAGENFR
jgi:hypothetical protein